MKNEFCPGLRAAIDSKTRTDAALLRLWQEMCAGTLPYSRSALLSAMENCDDAMDAVWLTFKPTVLTPVPPELACLNASGYDVRKAVESMGCAVADARAHLRATGQVA